MKRCAKLRKKRCDEMAPGTLEHNASDGQRPAWFRAVLCADSADISACSALDARGGTVTTVSNVYRGMWRTVWEPA